jgi:hypothetical protein
MHGSQYYDIKRLCFKTSIDREEADKVMEILSKTIIAWKTNTGRLPDDVNVLREQWRNILLYSEEFSKKRGLAEG